MTLLSDFGFALLCLLRAVIQVMIGRTRCQYAVSTDISAPRSLVWDVANAREITFDGAVPLTIRMAKDANAEGVVTGTVSVLDTELPMAFREIEMRPGVGGVIEVVPEGSAPQIALGRDYYISYSVADIPGGTRLEMVYELTHTSFSSRILVPLGGRQNARRIKAHAENLAGIENVPESAIGAAVVTGAITFASFFLLWGLDAAALLIATILIHELGHVIAMRWVGQPVRGIFFIPFFGGVAVASAPHMSEGNRGFVALMGPGFSILSTLAFYLIWQQDPDNELFGKLTFISAFLNVINLVPVLPLDGGQVLASLMSRSDPELRRFVNLTGVMVAAGAALYFEEYMALAVLALTLPAIFSSKHHEAAHQIAPMSGQAGVWLMVGYFATIAFYLAILGAAYAMA